MVLVISLMLNLALLLGAGWYLAERGARPIAEDLGIVEPRRPAFDVYAEEKFAGLEGEATVLIGDSQIALGPWSEVLDAPVAMRAQSGMRISEVTATAVDHIPADSERVIVWAGSNDAMDGHAPDRMAADMTLLLRAIASAAPDAEVIVLSLPPIEWADVSRANVAIEGAATRNGAEFVDVTSDFDGLLTHDGVHLTGAGYEVVAEALER